MRVNPWLANDPVRNMTALPSTPSQNFESLMSEAKDFVSSRADEPPGEAPNLDDHSAPRLGQAAEPDSDTSNAPSPGAAEVVMDRRASVGLGRHSAHDDPETAVVASAPAPTGPTSGARPAFATQATGSGGQSSPTSLVDASRLSVNNGTQGLEKQVANSALVHPAAYSAQAFSRPSTISSAENQLSGSVQAPLGGTLQEAQHRAFGLDELGMFGMLTGSSSAHDSRSKVALPAAVEPTVDQTGFSNALNGLGIRPDSFNPDGVSDAGAPTPIEMDLAIRAIGQSEIVASAVGQQLNGSIVIQAEVAAKGTDELAPPDVKQSPPAAEWAEQRSQATVRPKAGLSVLMTEVDGSVQIVSASPDVNAESARRLRRLADEAAAEFGKTVLTLSLNGQAIEREPIAFKGAE